MKKTILGLSLVSTMLFAADGASLYSTCMGCHGAHAEKKALGKSKVINTMSQVDLVNALSGYKHDTYGGAMKGLMKTQVAKLSEEDINTLSTYITTLKQ